MYQCANTRGRVVEKAEDGLMRCVFFSSLILFSVVTIYDIRAYLTAPQTGFSQITHVGTETISDLTSDQMVGGLQLPAYSHVSYSKASYAPGTHTTGLDMVGTSGHVVLTMDEDWASSDSFWREIKSKKKRKSRRNQATVQAKPDPSRINETPRSGLLTTKPGGSLFGIFSNSAPLVLPPKPRAIAGNVGRSGSGYRTLCVRLSDGYYWPISFSTNRDRFLKDRHVCKRSCAQRVRLFVYRNPGGAPEDMVDLKGRPYSELENAWRYREEYSTGRKCSPHPWEEASLAKHRAYAMMAKRSGARYVATAGLRGKRRLKRVGRIRTMSTIDLDFVENSRFKRSNGGRSALAMRAGANGVTARNGQRQSGGLVTRPARVGLGSRDFGTGAMALGGRVNAPKKARSRRAKPPRYRRKSGRSPDWIREALGID